MPNFFTNDILSVEFLPMDNNIDPIVIDNWTSFNIQKDFFTPSDTFNLILQDDRIYQLNDQLQAGMALNFKINKCPVMTGYIFKYHLTYSRNAGHSLSITGGDLLGWMSKAICLPTNIAPVFGSYEKKTTTTDSSGQDTTTSETIKTTNYHFKPTDTFYYAFQTLFNAFAAEVQLPTGFDIQADDAAFLSLSTGGAVGTKVPKKGRNLAKALQTQFQRLSAPRNDETFLAYALRLAKHLGCNINMAPARNADGTQTIFIMPPTYHRGEPSPFYLFHTFQTPSDNVLNTILEASFEIDMEHQPSVIIMEMQTSGNDTFYQSSQKVCCINELIGYERIPGQQLNGTPVDILDKAVSNVEQFLKPLMNINQSGAGLKIGYNILQPNQDLYDALPSTLVGLQTQLCLPAYMQDNSAHTMSELQFGVGMAMAEAQDKYFILNYTVQGFSQKERVWQPNMMVNVYDESIGQPNNALNGDFWIQKVNFIKQRGSPGTITHLQLGLPYTHSFNVTVDNTPPQPNVIHGSGLASKID